MILQSLERFWRALECLCGQATVLEEWRLCLGPEFDWAAPFLQPTSEVGLFYPRCDPLDRRRYQPPWDVVPIGEDAYWAVSPEGGPAIPITAAQLAVYEVHRGRLGASLSSALRLEPFKAIGSIGRGAQRIGTLIPKAGVRLPVFLVMAPRASRLPAVLSELAINQVTPYVALTPTREWCDALTESAIQRSGGILMPLAESFRIAAPGMLVTTDDCRCSLARFLEAQGAARPAAPVICPFPTPPGARWGDVRIRFLDGETISIRVGDVSEVRNFTQMGMVNRKNGCPTIQWELLRLFGEGHGVIDWSSRSAETRHRKRKQLLSDQLEAVFGMSDMPFENEGNGWRTVFRIDPESE